MASSEKAHLNLKATIERARKNQAVFKYLSDPIICEEWLPYFISSQRTSGPNILSTAIFGLFIFSTVGSGILTYKLRIVSCEWQIWLQVLKQLGQKHI